MSEIGRNEFGHLAQRLDMLNRLYPLQRELERVITQYKKGNIIGIRSQRPLRTIWSLKGVFQQLCMSSTSGKNRQSPKHRRNFRLEIDHRILHSF